MEGSSYNYGFSIMYDDNGTFGTSNALTLLRHDNSSTGSPFMTALRSNGRIGFGTTTPNSLVEIKTEISSSIDPTNHVTEALRLVAQYGEDWASSAHEGGVGIKFMLDNQNGGYWPAGEINFIGENSDNDEGHGGFQFKVTNNNDSGNDETTASANTTAMVINHEGKVGIGTTTPNAKLEVAGTTRITDLAGTGDRMVVANADGDLSTQAIPSGSNSGSNVGDMQYWDGSTWQNIPAGSNGAVLQLVSGVPTWVSSPDITAPNVSLVGDANMNIVLNGTFTDPGATTDEGTISTSGTVDVSTVGTYTLTYSATDATGNTGTATRTVAVYQSQYNYTGSVQTFTVPAGVTTISVDAYGASGSTNFYAGSEGKGGRVQTNLTVTPGQVLNIYVGGARNYAGYSSSVYAGGWNGGGSGPNPNCSGVGSAGGGATDIRIGGTALTDRVIVAGGGGGSANGGIDGGDGGGLIGQNGSGGSVSSGPRYGTGGSQSAGGAGGYSWYGDGTATYSIIPRSNAALGEGGDGWACDSGGGGGGYYGGGGGADAGGGGGSSYTHPTLCSSVVHTQGVRTGSGQLIITIP